MTLILSKPPHTHRIEYQPGDEGQVLDAIIEKVENAAIDFDWFDAAVLSHIAGAAALRGKKEESRP